MDHVLQKLQHTNARLSKSCRIREGARVAPSLRMFIDPSTFSGVTRVVQRSIPIIYKGMALDGGYRIDLIVADLVVVEVKAVAALLPIHEAQVLTYMKLAACPAGLLINFNVPRLVDGVKRLINPGAG